MIPEGISAEKRYQELATTRNHYLDRARDAACVTLPALMPREGFEHSSKLPTPYQSVGARGVNSLSSKLLMAMLPPNVPYFKLKLPEAVLDELTGGEPEMKAEAEAALARREATILQEIDAIGLRAKVSNGFRHLIVTGNILLNIPLDSKRKVRMFHLDQYCVLRTPQGAPLEVIIHEKVSLAGLPADALEAVQDVVEAERSAGDSPEPLLNMYSAMIFDKEDNQWVQWQEVKGVKFAERTVPKDKFEYLPLRWTIIEGESYGRGFAEDFLGDLLSLEGLSKAIVTAAAAAAKVLFLVRPNGTTKIKALANAPSGAMRQGHTDDVTVLNLEKSADMRVAQSIISQIENRLNDSFLMVAGATRDAERVTAEEIRLVAQELEETLGGTYTVLADEFQRPLLTMLTNRMGAGGRLPPMPKEHLQTSIVTGLEALGRGHDLRRLMQYTELAQSIMGPELFVQSHDMDLILQDIATATGVTNKYARPQQEVQAEQQQAAQQEQMMQLAGPAANLMKDPGIQQQMQQMQQAQEQS